MQSKQDLAKVLRMRLKYVQDHLAIHLRLVRIKHVFTKRFADRRNGMVDVGLGVECHAFEWLKPTHWKHHYMQVGPTFVSLSGET